MADPLPCPFLFLVIIYRWRVRLTSGNKPM